MAQRGGGHRDCYQFWQVSLAKAGFSTQPLVPPKLGQGWLHESATGVKLPRGQDRLPETCVGVVRTVLGSLWWKIDPAWRQDLLGRPSPLHSTGSVIS